MHPHLEGYNAAYLYIQCVLSNGHTCLKNEQFLHFTILDLSFADSPINTGHKLRQVPLTMLN